MFQPLILICMGLILCIIIGDVRQFIGHCLNHLYPWSARQTKIHLVLTYDLYGLERIVLSL